jgi:hypothetical protein
MADNVTINAGTGGPVVAADDISSVFYQRVKLALGADGSAADASAANPVPVTSQSTTMLAAVALSLDTAAYADGDVLADTQAFTSVARAADVGFVLQSVVLLDKDDQGMGVDLFFLSANNSLGTENAAPSISDANAEAIQGWVGIGSADWYDLGGARVAQRNNINLPLVPASGTTTLYVAAISRGTGTYTASGITVRLGVQRD